ncbi:hypothetical protein BaRGS_00008323 [Batillaria attramentaria]|uniref:Uridine 5'-monophosphate synthase n=1 Tax=Batillaria attramentaria TaxID=370345 RepID=A0ABD0LME6_9CAEN
MAETLHSRRLSLDELIVKLYEIEGVKFGDFKLKSGIQSPVYFDLRVIISYPELMVQVSEFLWDAASGQTFQSVCGVPYTALPLATIISAKHDLPMLIRRKEAKDYGTKKMIEGHFQPGDACLVVEDIVTSGGSVMETVEALSGVGVKVTQAVVLLDREQGGAERLKAMGIDLHSVCTLTKALEILQSAGKLDEDMVKRVTDFIAANRFSPNGNTSAVSQSVGDGQSPEKRTKKGLSFGERAQLCSNAVSRRLFEVMETKGSNLVLSADVTQSLQLLQLVDKIGPYVCAVKTHVDILEDFTPDFGTRLTELATKHDFLIFEDRKFADIGNTVSLQYEGGMYRISDWADIVNAHTVPGSGVVQGLKQVGQPKGGACLLIAEMSSAGNLANADYTKATVKMAEDHRDFVIGFICQSRLTSDPTFLHMTPGVQLEEGRDGLGQRYLTPMEVINNRGSDIIIVGRGIIKADNPEVAAKQYQEAGYSAYLSRLS